MQVYTFNERLHAVTAHVKKKTPEFCSKIEMHLGILPSLLPLLSPCRKGPVDCFVGSEKVDQRGSEKERVQGMHGTEQPLSKTFFPFIHGDLTEIRRTPD
mmetsp:Transcript_14173/g.28418  ORF Transcript_14173/g.28418 Transcript_14173/m.28418 type:complete len:100 (-) Transcript_14173:273-572(-)